MATQDGQQQGQTQGQGQGGEGGRGFAGMDEARQREIAAEGGRSVPDDKRSFAQDPELAAEAGRKGGQASGGGDGERRDAAEDRDDREGTGSETRPRDAEGQFRSDDAGR